MILTVVHCLFSCRPSQSRAGRAWWKRSVWGIFRLKRFGCHADLARHKLLHLPPEQIADWTTDSAVSGVELDDDGRAKGYWIHPARPDGVNSQYAPPVFVDAADALHIFRASGPGQVRGVSALAPVLLTLSELDGTEDALTLQTKIAATLSVILTNEDEMPAEDPLEDGQSLEPGAILRMSGNWRAGYSVEKVGAEIAADRERESQLGLAFGATSKEQNGIRT